MHTHMEYTKANLLAEMKAECELFIFHHSHYLYTQGAISKLALDSYLENIFKHFELYKLLLFYT